MRYAMLRNAAALVAASVSLFLGSSLAGQVSVDLRRTVALPGEEGFGRIVDVEVLGDGRVIVLDGLLQEIHLFAEDRTYLGQIGRPGRGPGEFSSVTDVLAMPDGLGAVDLNRIVTWNDDLHPDRVISRSDARILAAGLSEAGVVVKRIDVRRAWAIEFVSSYGSDGEEIILSDPLPRPGGAELRDLTRGEVTCARCSFAVAPNGRLAVALPDSTAGLLLFDTNGTALARIDLLHPPIPLSEAERAERERILARVQRSAAAPTHHIPIVKTLFRGTDEVWVQSRVTGDTYRVEVFSSIDGSRIGDIGIPPRERLLAITETIVLTALEDEVTGFDYLREYTLREGIRP